jgi:hypothetical protein
MRARPRRRVAYPPPHQVTIPYQRNDRTRRHTFMQARTSPDARQRPQICSRSWQLRRGPQDTPLSSTTPRRLHRTPLTSPVQSANMCKHAPQQLPAVLPTHLSVRRPRVMSRMISEAFFMLNSISFRSSTIFSICFVCSPSVAATCSERVGPAPADAARSRRLPDPTV